MNAPALGRDVAPLGRSLGATGFARGAPLIILANNLPEVAISLHRITNEMNIHTLFLGLFYKLSYSFRSVQDFQSALKPIFLCLKEVINSW
jgi:hypothetical protein